MARFYKKRDSNKGQSPGSLIFIGNKKVRKPRIDVFDYTKDYVHEVQIKTPEELIPYKQNTSTLTWINVVGLHDTQLIEEVGTIYELHPLIQEDILNTGQRAKLEEFEGYMFVTMKMLNYDNKKHQVVSEQLSMVFGKNFLITFQERKGDVFAPIRQRIHNPSSQLRKFGTDYLVYRLMDAVVDNYVYLVENIGEQIENLELKILKNSGQEVLSAINMHKRELNFASKTMRPARDMIMRLNRQDEHFISKKTRPFLKDLLDIIVHVTETIDSYREMLSDFLNIYHTGISARLNSIMKVLTIFSTIFIPLTFIAGIYGMNFENMPELHHPMGYPIAMSAMAVVGVSILMLMKYKKWL
ncbi:magnesium/cobalt transporter CorA [Rapidithrix thailandica]|uniref:Magnesium transport protein CorA n=1 Tax=Rapidithrix thailandica TaxID=413964 RepID=A0AAW9S5Q5_9BACT